MGEIFIQILLDSNPYIRAQGLVVSVLYTETQMYFAACDAKVSFCRQFSANNVWFLSKGHPTYAN